MYGLHDEEASAAVRLNRRSFFRRLLLRLSGAGDQ